PEGVVHVRVGQGGQGGRELRAVFGLTWLEAEVLEQDDVTCVQIADELRDAVADDLVGEPDLAAEQFGEDAGDRLHRELGLELAFGASEMRRQDEPGTAVQKGL